MNQYMLKDNRTVERGRKGGREGEGRGRQGDRGGEGERGILSLKLSFGMKFALHMYTGLTEI